MPDIRYGTSSVPRDDKGKPVYPPKGKSSTKVLRGGPWAKEKHSFTELPDGTIVPSQIPITRGDGSYVGRYVLVAKQQKNRTLKVMEWETPEQQARAIRLAVFTGVWV